MLASFETIPILTQIPKKTKLLVLIIARSYSTMYSHASFNQFSLSSF